MPIVYSSLVVQGDAYVKHTFTHSVLTSQSKSYINTDHLSFIEGSANRFNLSYNENKSGIYNKNGILYFNVDGDNKLSLSELQLTVNPQSEFNNIVYFNDNVIFKNLIPGILTDLDVLANNIVINIVGKYYNIISGSLQNDDIFYTNGQWFKVKDTENNELFNTGTANNNTVERILTYSRKLEAGKNRVIIASDNNEVSIFLPSIETFRISDTIQLYLEIDISLLNKNNKIKIKSSGTEKIINKNYIDISLSTNFIDITFIRSFKNNWLIS